MSTAKLSTGVEIYYEVYGKGDTVVLLQGTGLPCDAWRDYTAADLKDRYQVVIMDPRGIGRSSPVDYFFTVYQLAADVAVLLDHLAVDRAHILGHSIGGRIALCLGVNYPGKVRSLILASTGSGSVVRTGEDAISLPQLRLLERLITRGGLKEHMRYEIFETDGYFTESFRKSQPEVVAAFYKLSWEYHADLRTYLRYLFARHTFEITHQLGSITTPAVIMIGDADIAGGGPHLPANLALKDRMPPHTELKLLPNRSHGFFWEDPAGTKAILLDWLEKH